jgi:hypothetical protein
MNNVATTKKEDYKNHFTSNTMNWLESRGFDPEKIYKALNKENINLNSAEKKLVNHVLKLNSKTDKWFKPVGVQDDLRNIKNTKESIPIKKVSNGTEFVPTITTENKQMKNEIQFKPIKDSIEKYSKQYGIDEKFIPMIIITEFSGDKDKNRAYEVAKNINNPKTLKKMMNTNGEYNETSYGLGQFTKPTLEGLLEKGDSFEKVINDPDLSVKYMAKFISKLVNDYDCKTIEEIALAYNAGPGTLKKLKEKYGNDWTTGAQSEIDAYAKKIGKINKKGRLYIGLNYVKKAQEAYKQIS